MNTQENKSMMESSFFEGGGKLRVKVAKDTVIKRVREAPTNFEGLKKTFKSQVCKDEKSLELMEKNQLEIVYTDDVGDVINVSDDEDLLVAYEVAETSMNNQIKFTVQPRKKAQEDFDPQVTKIPAQAEEEEKVPISGQQEVHQFIQAAIKDVAKNTDAEQSSDDSSDSEEKIQPGGKKQKKKGPKCKKAKDGVPKKGLKKMIKKELDKQINDLNNQNQQKPQAAHEPQGSSLAPEKEEVIHEGVQCDGCGQNPIVGIRYKCSVRKNFDFCAKCEEQKEHEYAFLKITNPKLAPKFMVSGVDENMQNAHADFDVDNYNFEEFASMANQFANAFKQPQSEPQGPTENTGGQTKGGPANTGHVPFGGQGVRLDGSAGQEQTQGQCNPLRMFREAMRAAGQGGCHWGGRGGRGGHWGRGRGGFGGRGGGFGGHWGGHGDGTHKKNRGKIIDVPQEVLKASPGETIFKQIEMRNNTHWPYKPGCSIRSYFTNKATEVLGTVNVPIDFEVQPLSNYKVTIPLNISENAVADEGIINADFALTGPMGSTFGEPIQLKFKIVKKLDELEFFQIAMKLFEESKKTNKDVVFEEVVEILKIADSDEEVAKKMLIEMNSRPELNSQFQTNNDDDDFYS